VGLGAEPAPGQRIGGGSLPELFEAAADVWESAILDDVVLDVFYDWFDLSAQGFAGQNIGSFVLLDNAATSWFMDPTPRRDEEWSASHETVLDLGGGPMNVGHVFTDPDPALTGNRLDLYSLLLHEIGHAIGFRIDRAFRIEVADGDIDIAPPLPFAGAAIANLEPAGNSADHLELPETTMHPFFGNERRLVTEADIVALAQVQGYAQVDLSPGREPVTEPDVGWLVGAAALLGRRLRGNTDAG
jgi:hypothetical protein